VRGFRHAANRAYRRQHASALQQEGAPVSPTVTDVFTPEPASPGRARSLVREALDTWGVEDELHAAELLTSELVTNAVTHASTPVVLHLTLDRNKVRVEIADAGDELPALVEVPETGGLGLRIVDRLESRWGIEQIPDDGKNVWFELDLIGDVPPPSDHASVHYF
jgi:hypothetical protein